MFLKLFKNNKNMIIPISNLNLTGGMVGMSYNT